MYLILWITRFHFPFAKNQCNWNILYICISHIIYQSNVLNIDDMNESAQRWNALWTCIWKFLSQCLAPSHCWTKVDLSSKGFCGIHLRAILREVLCPKMTALRLLPYLLRASVELRRKSVSAMGLIPCITWRNGVTTFGTLRVSVRYGSREKEKAIETMWWMISHVKWHMRYIYIIRHIYWLRYSKPDVDIVNGSLQRYTLVRMTKCSFTPSTFLS